MSGATFMRGVGRDGHGRYVNSTKARYGRFNCKAVYTIIML